MLQKPVLTSPFILELQVTAFRIYGKSEKKRKNYASTSKKTT